MADDVRFPGPDAETAQAARILLDQAMSIAAAADSARIAAYLRAGQLAREAKQRLGHGHWLGFLFDHYRQSERTLRRTMAVADAIDADAWLAARVQSRPEQWSVRKILEYATASADLKREMRETKVARDLVGGDRVPLEEATAAQLRHHKRYVSGQLPKPDPLAAALAKSHFLPPEMLALQLEEVRKRVAWIRDRANLANEDVADDDRVKPLRIALHDLETDVANFRGDLEEAAIAMKCRTDQI